jgi:3-dehydroquinate synthase
VTNEIEVDLGERRYSILLGVNLIGQRGLLDEYLSGKQALIVTNDTVKALYLDALISSLPESMKVDTITLPDGEAHKTLETYARVIDKLVEARHNRTTTVIALGGGVVGDVAGFAAATYQRGVAFVQIPTTLLALVDSAVGGKTAVNHAQGKNLIGAFYQPRCVIADVATLRTLPERELRAGLAEIIKYGVIYDPQFFDWIDEQLERLVTLETDPMIYAVRRSCEIKAAVVRADEREMGERAILNYGHTFGHALETVTGYQQLLHGEAVAIGMVMAADLSMRLGWLPAAQAVRIRELIKRAGLPVVPPSLSSATVLEAMNMDKKVVDGQIRLVLAKGIGEVIVSDGAPTAAILETLNAKDTLCLA